MQMVQQAAVPPAGDICGAPSCNNPSNGHDLCDTCYRAWTQNYMPYGACARCQQSSISKNSGKPFPLCSKCKRALGKSYGGKHYGSTGVPLGTMGQQPGGLAPLQQPAAPAAYPQQQPGAGLPSGSLIPQTHFGGQQAQPPAYPPPAMAAGAPPGALAPQPAWDAIPSQEQYQQPAQAPPAPPQAVSGGATIETAMARLDSAREVFQAMRRNLKRMDAHMIAEFQALHEKVDALTHQFLEHIAHHDPQLAPPAAYSGSAPPAAPPVSPSGPAAEARAYPAKPAPERDIHAEVEQAVFTSAPARPAGPLDADGDF